ncbi:unnamed protein product, partial [Mycena citricolor]
IAAPDSWATAQGFVLPAVSRYPPSKSSRRENKRERPEITNDYGHRRGLGRDIGSVSRQQRCPLVRCPLKSDVAERVLMGVQLMRPVDRNREA